jgi:hypothetical protein
MAGEPSRDPQAGIGATGTSNGLDETPVGPTNDAATRKSAAHRVFET